MMPGLRDMFRGWLGVVSGRAETPKSTPMPAGQLTQMLNQAAPKPIERKWVRVASVRSGDGRILVFDPWYHDPAVRDENHVYDVELQGQPGIAEVHLELVNSAVGVAVAGVRILWAETSDVSREAVGSVSVDSGLLAIARASDASTRYRRGGPQSQSSLWLAFGEGRAQRAKNAAELLMAAGFALKPEKDETYVFSPALEEDEIVRARAVLRDASSDAMVNVSYPQIVHDITKGLESNSFVALYEEADPFLLGFCPGYGDGTYEWSELRKGDRVVGFECVMFDPEDAE